MTPLEGPLDSLLHLSRRLCFHKLTSLIRATVTAMVWYAWYEGKPPAPECVNLSTMHVYTLRNPCELVSGGLTDHLEERTPHKPEKFKIPTFGEKGLGAV